MQLNLETLQVSANTFSEIINESDGIMKFHGVSVSNFQSTVQEGARTENLLISSRFSSQKSIMTAFRPATYTATTSNSTGGRFFPSIVDYVYNVSGVLYPSLPIKTSKNNGTPSTGEGFYELVKVFDGQNNNQFSCKFNKSNYESRVPDTKASYLLGYSFEQGGYLANDMGLGSISGLDTIGSNSFITLNLVGTSDSATPPTATVAMLVDTYVIYDIIIEIDASTGMMNITR